VQSLDRMLKLQPASNGLVSMPGLTHSPQYIAAMSELSYLCKPVKRDSAPAGRRAARFAKRRKLSALCRN
jgi:hypothetical protein